jgi:hypothetical protein
MFEAAWALRDVGNQIDALPRSVEVLASQTFHQCARPTKVAFEDGPLLHTIGDNCFAETPLIAINIPGECRNHQEGRLHELTFEPNPHVKAMKERCFAVLRTCSPSIGRGPWKWLLPQRLEQGDARAAGVRGDSMLKEIKVSCFAASVIRLVVIPRRCAARQSQECCSVGEIHVGTPSSK